MLTEYRNIIYDELMATLRKAVRNGNWRKRKFIDKALYRAACGMQKAVEMLDKGEENIHVASTAALSKIQQSI